MERFRIYRPYLLIILLFIFASFIWYVVYTKEHSVKYLKVAYLDIGQGDSIYIEAPNGNQMLIDGGPGASILSQLAEVMPYGDRSIDIVIATNPDSDHIGGLVEVLQEYKVGKVIEPGTKKDTSVHSQFQSLIESKKIEKITGRRGMHIVIDQEKNIYFDILYPDHDVSFETSNDGSLVGKLVYKETSFMFMGDATRYAEVLVHQNESPQTLHATVLKIGHHGSRTSSSDLWLEDVDPDLAVISAGKSNRYGHPHSEVTDSLKALSIPYFVTSEKGTILINTDGLNLSYGK